jgi:hypothetical protein
MIVIPGQDPAVELSTAAHTLMTRYRNEANGKEYIYVQADGAITQYQAVSITPAGQAAALTKANADKGYKVGVAQIAFTDDYYGWILVVDPIGTGSYVRAASACASETLLYTTATAGRIDDSDTGQTAIEGIELTATAATAAASANATCKLNDPKAFVAEVTVDANVAAITVASSQASLATLAASSAMSSASIADSKALLAYSAGSSAMSSAVAASSQASINWNWLSVASEFSSRVVAGSAVDSAGSDCFASEAVFGQIWNTIGSAISSASA